VFLFLTNIAKFDEANTRTDFIDNFFMLLDFEIANNQSFTNAGIQAKEAAEKNQQLITMITSQIEDMNKAIDKEVYVLYNLTEDEIKVVEDKNYYLSMELCTPWEVLPLRRI
jgi:hypothetical protein